jgi:hypothetical protein
MESNHPTVGLPRPAGFEDPEWSLLRSCELRPHPRCLVAVSAEPSHCSDGARAIALSLFVRSGSRCGVCRDARFHRQGTLSSALVGLDPLASENFERVGRGLKALSPFAPNPAG